MRASILAAGEGKRLEPFVRRLRGDGLPKQYVNFIGRRSMLEHTFHRAEKIVPGDRLLTVVAKHHLLIPEVRRQLAARTAQTIVVQPANKETGPGLLLPFVRLYARHPESTVVVFPSDHFILDEDLLLPTSSSPSRRSRASLRASCCWACDPAAPTRSTVTS